MTPLAHNRADAFPALGDPVRRDLFRVVASAREAVGRDAAAEALGIPRSTAAFHLDRLVEAGVLVVEYRRLSGRSGPGAGRPAKLYRPVSTEIAGSLPERHYELASELFAAAIERAAAEGVPVESALADEARATGEAIGAEHEGAGPALVACGYEPRDDGEGGILLENCPFHALVTRHADLVCGTNLSLVEGIVAGSGDARHPVLAPREGACCVALRADASPGAAPIAARRPQ